MKNIKKAFTLGEILMALGIIGIISAITIPQVIASKMSTQAKSEFNTAYSNLSRVVSEMDADEVSTNRMSYLTEYSFYNKLKQYMNYALDCGHGSTDEDSPCYETNKYKNYAGKTMQLDWLWDDGSLVINNGMLIMIENNVQEGKNENGILISVDINGKSKPPNRVGWDVFTFEVSEGEIFPVGAPRTTNSRWRNNPESYCSTTENVNSQDSGVTCSYFALTEDDYFSKLYHGR